MKFQVTFKTPDTLRDATGYAATKVVKQKENTANLAYEEFDDEVNEVWDQLMCFTKKWVQYGETITIEFDTDAGTATVLPIMSG